jgi:hypothetical protein
MYDIFGDRVLESFYKVVLCLKIFGEKSITSPHCRSQLGVFEMATTSIQASNLFNVNGLVAVITGGGSGALTNSTESENFHANCTQELD